MAETAATDFFSLEEKNAIRDAIVDAEMHTSGEIRVHIENHCKGDSVEHASKMFNKLKMHKTAERNAVLFFLAVTDRVFVIYGDSGINAKVPEDFWDSIRDQMLVYFREKKFTQGLCEGIRMAGEKLQEHFPHQKDDKDELTNEVSFS
jgi:uncharacterized membrane protein